jgi:hypothetical protein
LQNFGAIAFIVVWADCGTSAVLLKRTVSLNSDMTIQQCKRYLDAVNLGRIAIPAICKAEISRIQGRSD